MKTAVVTGGSTGIGRAVTLALSKVGFEVMLVARRVEELERTKKLIEEAGGKAWVFPADLSNVEDIQRLIEQIKNQVSSIDLIANIAGIWHGENDVYAGKDFDTFETDIIIKTFNVGTIAPALLIHGLLPFMKPGSKIINLSGTFENGGKGWIPYFASKRALEDLTVGLADELKDKDIQVNCVSPSDTATTSYAKFFPEYMDDAITPEKIAEKFVELSHPDNKTTGKVIVMKKGTDPLEHFHY